MTLHVDAPIEALTAQAAWSRRVLRVGGLIQVSFAGLWLVRGGLAVGAATGMILALVLCVAAVAVFGYGVRATAGIAPRPSGSEARRIERAVTVATIIQLVASFAAPALVIAAGHPDWVLPSIAVTIGPLLLWLDHRISLPRYRAVGWTLTVGPVFLVAALSGTPLVATTGIAAGGLLLATAAAGFHDLAGSRPPSDSTDPAVGLGDPLGR